jgi:hypothetical protein
MRAAITLATMGLLLWLAVAQTQSPAAPALRGRVLEASGRPVEGALVSLKKIDTGTTTTVLSGTDGAYAFQKLDAGVGYELRAEHEGLTSVRPLRFSSPEEKAGINLIVLAPIQFEDAAPRAGLNFMLRNGATGRFYQPEIMLGGVAAIDYNNDGCMDIFFTNGAELPSIRKSGPDFHNRLYRNNCDMTFTDVTEMAGLAGVGFNMGVAVADYDNDGFADIFVTGLNRNVLYRNKGDGTFEDVTARAGLGAAEIWSVSAGWFDYDNDGYPDLFIANYVAWTPETEVACSEGGKPFYCHPRVYQPLPNQLFHNNHDGTFTDVSEASGIRAHRGKGMGVAFGDFNGDGLTDIFVTNDSMPNFLFENLGNGRFKEVATERGVAYGFHGNAVAGMGADFRDFNNDGLDDIALDAMYFETFPLYRNAGKPNYFVDDTISSGLATATRNLTGWGMGFFDFDNDGYKDLFFATSHFPGSEPHVHSDPSLGNHVLHNLGNGRFEDVSAIAGRDFQRPAMNRGVAFADFDNDGRVDAVVTGINSYARLFRNTSARTGHWLALRLRGTKSNRDGLGARVMLTSPEGRRQHNHATTSVGYASSSEPLVRFGLGLADTATEIEVRWPSGRVQVLRNIRVDRVLEVREPD